MGNTRCWLGARYSVVSYFPQVGIPIGIVITLAGIVLLIRAHRSKVGQKQELDSQKAISIKPQEGSLDTVTIQDRLLIEGMSLDMTITHGRMDMLGLLADRASGIPLNELIARPCSRCRIPRNQRVEQDE